MKKLLLIAVLATMATTAMAVNPKQGTKVESKVEVRAEIVSGGLKITDIYGKPLILDLGQANQGEITNLSNTIEYKITSKAAAETSPINLSVELKDTTLAIYNANADLTANNANDKLDVTLYLDKATKTIAIGEQVVTGTITGATKTNAGNTVGRYSNSTYITATVTQ